MLRRFSYILLLDIFLTASLNLNAQSADTWTFGFFAGPNFSSITKQSSTFNLGVNGIGQYPNNKSIKYPIEYMVGAFANSKYFSDVDRILIRTELFVNKIRDDISYFGDIDTLKFISRHVYLGFHLMAGWTNEALSVYTGVGYGYNTNGSNTKIKPDDLLGFQKEVQEVVQAVDNVYIPLILSYKFDSFPITFQIRANVGLRDVIFVKSNGLNFLSSPKNILNSFGITFNYQIPAK